MPPRKNDFDQDYLDRQLFEVLNLHKGGSFYVAYSGGMDSTVLLHAMVGLRERYRLALTALHMDHGLQEGSDGWRQHCSLVCEQWDVPFESERTDLVLDKSIGVEASARNARYYWLQSRLSGDVCYLLTAHHQQDQAETFLLNLLRGAGVDGLSASIAVLPIEAGLLVRPFLNISQEAIHEYAGAWQLDWVTDPSNTDESFRRNHIRGRLIPVLKDIKPDAVEQISTAINNLQNARSLLDEVGAEDLASIEQAEAGLLDGSRGLEIRNLSTWSSQRFANLVRYWLRSLNYPVPDSRLIAQLQAWRFDDPPGTSILGQGDVQFRCFQGILYVMPVLGEAPEIPERAWTDPATPLSIPEIGISLNCDPRLHTYADLVVRGREGGERLAAQGGPFRKDLRKYFQDANVPPWLRFRLPLVFKGTELVAIPGLGQFGSLEGVAPHEPLVTIRAQ